MKKLTSKQKNVAICQLLEGSETLSQLLKEAGREVADLKEKLRLSEMQCFDYEIAASKVIAENEALRKASSPEVEALAEVIEDRDSWKRCTEGYREEYAELQAELKRVQQIDDLWAGALEMYFVCTVKNIKARDDINAEQAARIVALEAEIKRVRAE